VKWSYSYLVLEAKRCQGIAWGSIKKSRRQETGAIRRSPAAKIIGESKVVSEEKSIRSSVW
jgi:hypothetical protein